MRKRVSLMAIILAFCIVGTLVDFALGIKYSSVWLGAIHKTGIMILGAILYGQIVRLDLLKR